MTTSEIDLCTALGAGEHCAYVVLYSPDGAAERVVLLSTDHPCDVGLRFSIEGAAWVVTRPLPTAGDGMFAAQQVEQ